jgi:hypothetical protein
MEGKRAADIKQGSARSGAAGKVTVAGCASKRAMEQGKEEREDRNTWVGPEGQHDAR